MPSNRRNLNTKQSQNRLKFHEFAAIMVFMVLASCFTFIVVSGLFYSGDNLSQAQRYAIQTQIALNATPTATPIQAEGEPSFPENPVVDNPENDPEEAVTPDPSQPIEEPEPTATTRVLQQPEGQVNILLLGSDARPNEGGFRTDVILWLSLNPEDGFVSAISFPRDLYVSIPGYGYNRINTAFIYGGFGLLADTFEVNFGFRPDHYVLVDFNGFKTVINDLGGIDVQAAQNLSDSCANWINPSGWCSVGPGTVHMDGEVALWYARSRYSSSDIDRGRRAQEVINAIFNRLMKLDVILKAPDLYKSYTTYVDTDVSLTDVVSLLPLANKIYESGDIRSYVIGYEHAYDWITPEGAMVLLPDITLVQSVMFEAMGYD
jgi:LCP family protein required for cell wall assembly